MAIMANVNVREAFKNIKENVERAIQQESGVSQVLGRIVEGNYKNGERLLP